MIFINFLQPFFQATSNKISNHSSPKLHTKFTQHTGHGLSKIQLHHGRRRSGCGSWDFRHAASASKRRRAPTIAKPLLVPADGVVGALVAFVACRVFVRARWTSFSHWFAQSRPRLVIVAVLSQNASLADACQLPNEKPTVSNPQFRPTQSQEWGVEGCFITLILATPPRACYHRSKLNPTIGREWRDELLGKRGIQQHGAAPPGAGGECESKARTFLVLVFEPRRWRAAHQQHTGQHTGETENASWSNIERVSERTSEREKDREREWARKRTKEGEESK